MSKRQDPQEPSALSGSCYCGSVRFSIEAPFGGSAHCHCSMCRRAHGAAFVSWLVTMTERFSLESDSSLRWFASSEQSERGFCNTCGTTLFFRSSVCPGETHVTLASLEEGHGVTPELHCFTDHSVSWAPISDDLPRYDSTSEALARYRAIEPMTRREAASTDQTRASDQAMTRPRLAKVNLQEKLALFDEQWSPRVVAELNGQQVKVAKVEGPFDWHHHEAEDELFLVVEGRLHIELRDETIQLDPGELLVVPRGVEHRPVSDGETHIVLFEPKSTLNTGNIVNERTVAELQSL